MQFSFRKIRRDKAARGVQGGGAGGHPGGTPPQLLREVAAGSLPVDNFKKEKKKKKERRKNGEESQERIQRERGWYKIPSRRPAWGGGHKRSGIEC